MRGGRQIKKERKSSVKHKPGKKFTMRLSIVIAWSVYTEAAINLSKSVECNNALMIDVVEAYY